VFDDQIGFIRCQFEELKRADPRLEQFGALWHRYVLQSPVTSDAIAAFERQHNVCLPDDYRAFLTKFAAGGAGPHYGLSAFPCHSNDIAKPFPHTQVWNDSSDFRPDSAEHKRWEEDYFSDAHIAGTLSLCQEGCGHVTLLVTTGDARGTIWCDSRVSDGGIYPLCRCESPSRREYGVPSLYDSSPQRRMTFLEWYMTWLDRTLEWVKLTAVSRRQSGPEYA
jgi:hypothetical protein